MCNCPYPAYCQCYEVNKMNQEPEDFLKYVTVAHLKFEIQKLHDLITTLERMVDIQKIKEVLFHGAETHASILRCEAQYKELHKYISDCDVMRFGADQRLEEMITKIDKNCDNACAENGQAIKKLDEKINAVRECFSQCIDNHVERIEKLESIYESDDIYRKCNRCENTTFQIRGHLQNNDLVFVCNACRYSD